MSDFTYILDKKETFDSPYCGEEIVDLLSQTFRIPEDFEFTVYQTREDHTCRPDLLSYDAYGTDEYGDLLLKLNGISNPFELNGGMYIIVPKYDYLEQFQIVPAKSTIAGSDPSEFIPVASNPLNHVKKQRTTNEALLNSNRYKINPSTGVITY